MLTTCMRIGAFGELEEEDHKGILEMVLECEDKFFKDQKDPLNLMAVLIFRELPKIIPSPETDYKGNWIVMIEPILENSPEYKVAWGHLWADLIKDPGFISGFQMSEAFMTEITPNQNIHEAFKDAINNPSNKIVRRESLLFIICDNKGWQLARTIPFLRPEEGSVPLRWQNPQTFEGDEVLKGRILGN
jgi:hypothetical protein